MIYYFCQRSDQICSLREEIADKFQHQTRDIECEEKKSKKDGQKNLFFSSYRSTMENLSANFVQCYGSTEHMLTKVRTKTLQS